MQFLPFLCRPHNVRILQPKEDNYIDNCSGRARFTNKVLKHVEARERWRFGERWQFVRLDWRFGLVKTQKVQRVHQLECSYTSIMLSLRYSFCLFYTNYASTKKRCYVVSWLSVYFLPPQRRMTIWAIGWEVRSGQHFRRFIEFISLNFRMLLLCYHYVIVYAVFTKCYALTKKLQHKKKNYSDNHSGRAYKQGTLTVKGLTNKVL